LQECKSNFIKKNPYKTFGTIAILAQNLHTAALRIEYFLNPFVGG